MKIKQIYKKFKNPSNLQKHMLFVGALAKVITDNWIGEKIDKDAVIQACLLHDLAKPVNFDLKKQAQYGLSEEEIQKLADFQRDLKVTYGETEHQIVIAICKKIGCSSVAVSLINDLEWEYLQKFLQEDKVQSMIPIYCDMRIAPNGIWPLKDRLEELKGRDHDSNRMDELAKSGLELEKVLQAKVKINLEDISNIQINQVVEKLKEFEL